MAVLPVAATEQHGPHLPLSVDQTLVDGVVAAALPHLPAAASVLFLPTQQVGYSPEHSRFRRHADLVLCDGDRNVDRTGRMRGPRRA